MKATAPKTLSYSVFYEQDSEGGFVALVPSPWMPHPRGDVRRSGAQRQGGDRPLSRELIGSQGARSSRGPVIPGKSYSSSIYSRLEWQGFLEGGAIKQLQSFQFGSRSASYKPAPSSRRRRLGFAA